MRIFFNQPLTHVVGESLLQFQAGRFYNVEDSTLAEQLVAQKIAETEEQHYGALQPPPKLRLTPKTPAELSHEDGA
jgi:hypothetical protein